MDRLTSRTPLTEFDVMNLSLKDLYMRLKNYEDAEEEGRLIVLPCKVGDTVWYIPSGTRKIYSGICHCVSIQRGGVNIHLYDFDGDNATYPASRVFFTSEEAEAALGGDGG